MVSLESLSNISVHVSQRTISIEQQKTETRAYSKKQGPYTVLKSLEFPLFILYNITLYKVLINTVVLHKFLSHLHELSYFLPHQM